MPTQIEPLVPISEFPVAQTCTYINAANVAPMYRPAATAITEWYQDVAENGSNHFNEEAEQTVLMTFTTRLPAFLAPRPLTSLSALAQQNF